MDRVKFRVDEGGRMYYGSEFFNCDNIWDVWLISDTHFNHYPKDWTWPRIKDWQQIIIQRWNRMVGVDDIVLHMGDFAFGAKRTVVKTVEKLNGKIYLIKGNHDRHSAGWYDDCRVTLIKKPFIVKCEDRGLYFLFSHRKQCKLPSNTVNIHGHSHDKKWFIMNEGSGAVKGTTYINVSVEKIDYRPIRLNSLMYRAEDVHFSRLVI